MADVFISYAREDEKRVAPLATALEARGWSVFWDRRIPAGQTWRSYIGRALEQARCVVVAWSAHSIQSDWVLEEADEGKVRGVLVPVLLDKVLPPRGFRGLQAADLVGWTPKRSLPSFDVFLTDLEALLRLPPRPGSGNKQTTPSSDRSDASPQVAVQRRFSWALSMAMAGLAVAALAAVATYLLLVQGDGGSGITASPSAPIFPGPPPASPAQNNAPPASVFPEAPPLGPSGSDTSPAPVFPGGPPPAPSKN